MIKNLTEKEINELACSGRKLTREEVDSILFTINGAMEQILFDMKKIAAEHWPETHQIRH